MIPFFNARASDGSTGCGWAGNARRLSYRDLNEKKVRGRVFRHVCLANDSIAFMCAGCISMVPVVAAAVHKVTPTVAIIVWTLSIIPTYYVWHLPIVARPW
jgi:hypothetical protein